MTTEEDGNSLDGIPPERFAPALVARGADVVGLNCSVGPAPMLETLERMADVVSVPLSARNAMASKPKRGSCPGAGANWPGPDTSTQSAGRPNGPKRACETTMALSSPSSLQKSPLSHSAKVRKAGQMK